MREESWRRYGVWMKGSGKENRHAKERLGTKREVGMKRGEVRGGEKEGDRGKRGRDGECHACI